MVSSQKSVFKAFDSKKGKVYRLRHPGRQVDLSTRHKALTNALGFASFEDPEGSAPVGCRLISKLF